MILEPWRYDKAISKRRHGKGSRAQSWSGNKKTEVGICTESNTYVLTYIEINLIHEYKEEKYKRTGISNEMIAEC